MSEARTMADKRDRRVAMHYLWPPVCATTHATKVPHNTSKPELVTCKRCLHLMGVLRHGTDE